MHVPPILQGYHAHRPVCGQTASGRRVVFAIQNRERHAMTHTHRLTLGEEGNMSGFGGYGKDHASAGDSTLVRLKAQTPAVGTDRPTRSDLPEVQEGAPENQPRASHSRRNRRPSA